MAKLLNIRQAQPDAQLATTWNVIENAHAVADLAGLEQKLVELAGEHQPPDTEQWLDLIGHAYEGVLQLGTSAIENDPSRMRVFAKTCKSALQALRVTKVRLLGCGTASTPAGRDAIRALKTALENEQLPGIDVLGTTVPISSHNFDAAGLKSTFKGIVSRKNLPIPGLANFMAAARDEDAAWAERRDMSFKLFRQILPGASLPELMRGLTPESLDEILRERDRSPCNRPWEVRLMHMIPGDLSPIQAVLLPGCAVAPGLLAGTEVELLVPASRTHGQMFYRLTVLLDSSFVRIYLPEEPLGRLLPVTSRAELRAVVERADPLPSLDTPGPGESAAHRTPSM